MNKVHHLDIVIPRAFLQLARNDCAKLLADIEKLLSERNDGDGCLLSPFQQRDLSGSIAAAARSGSYVYSEIEALHERAESLCRIKDFIDRDRAAAERRAERIAAQRKEAK